MSNTFILQSPWNSIVTITFPDADSPESVYKVEMKSDKRKTHRNFLNDFFSCYSPYGKPVSYYLTFNDLFYVVKQLGIYHGYSIIRTSLTTEFKLDESYKDDEA